MAPQHKVQLINRLSVFLVSFPLLILSFSTVYLLFLSSDDSLSAIWRQCSPQNPKGLLPKLSQVPVVGQASCYLISFFNYALDSSRAFAVMSVILSFIGALLTIMAVESARIFNSPNYVIRNPTLPWLFFNLAGGAVVWQVIIIPAFIARARRACRVQDSTRSPNLQNQDWAETSTNSTDEVGERDPNRGSSKRHLHNQVEIYAISISVVIGYVLPSIAMLFIPNPISITAWLFFPLWVSLARQAIRYLLILLPQFPQFTDSDSDTHHMESYAHSVSVVYALSVFLSIVSQSIIFNDLLEGQDGSPITGAALGLIEVDFLAVALTVFYLLLLEAGWVVLSLSLVCSILAGPGAGLVLGWILREKKLMEIDS
ncbi:hypothetical protein B7494_g8283 [Chlorociboria aeruginascens]|nr:hypothetical protein B7494_g8283 [Chlorociboria aeruginascens]